MEILLFFAFPPTSNRLPLTIGCSLSLPAFLYNSRLLCCPNEGVLCPPPAQILEEPPLLLSIPENLYGAEQEALSLTRPVENFPPWKSEPLLLFWMRPTKCEDLDFSPSMKPHNWPESLTLTPTKSGWPLTPGKDELIDWEFF